jgi:4'-phosphopantetheinyl transferase EntD
MAQIYTVMAYSPKLNQTQREFDQDSLQGRHTLDQRTAQRKADSFAARLNARHANKTADWQGRIELITTII